ncbi:MAG: PD-(D/E)XK nuclease family protein [Bacteroidales bacterium]|nr:PD-(D/E)XK nuclease family protein [Bacteroidales bacterium]
MTPFLQQVAVHYFTASDIENHCFIFPNRRSMVFFKKYLQEAVADRMLNAMAPGHGGIARPVLLPRLLTVSDFFQTLYGSPAADRVTLLLELYDVYRSLNPRAEPLDDFIFWGDVILGDFGDVDKYRVDPKQLFTNVAEFRDIQDTFSYLTPEQQAAIEGFVSHFKSGGRLKVDPDAEHPSVKERFLQVWNLLYPLYTGFRERLEEKGLAYEGMVYRTVADRMADRPAADVLADVFPGTQQYVFVGLNALNECEKKVMRRMRDAGLASFCWDWCSPMIRDPHNRSSFFMARNVSDFPMDWSLEKEETLPDFRVISVPSSVGQAKQLPSILAETGAGMDCAVVLPDETLLMPVLNSIPEDVPDINVTMGFPMTGSEIWSLMDEAAVMQLHLREREGETYFYHKQVWNIFSSSIFRRLAGPEGEALVRKVREEARYYIPQSDLSGLPLFDHVFRPVVRKPSEADPQQIADLQAWQEDLLRFLGPALAEDMDMVQEAEFTRRYLDCVRRLRKLDLAVQPATYTRLVGQLLAGESVPYNGEPLKGLQVMGPLETRALDFRHLIILSCNEGVFPHRSVSSSFIPPELRKGFGLPTYEFQDAVWAYYFYRMIQRAETVWMLYDSRTEKMKPGEESRYIKQLRYHFRVPLRFSVAKAEIRRPEGGESIPKPADFAQRLRETRLSATSLQNWLACPAKFYYGTIEKLKAENEVSESLDAGMIGNVYHAAMQALYLGDKAMDPSFRMDRESVQESIRCGTLRPLEAVTDPYLAGWEGRKKEIKARIRSLIREELHSIEVSGRNLVLEDVILQYVLMTIRKDRELLREKGTDRFRILGLELAREWQFEGYKFFGYIDRMDSFEDGTVRIVDYKTGRVEDADVRIDDANAQQVTEKLFGPDNQHRPKIALQLFLYDMYAANMPQAAGKRIVNTIYPAAKLFTEGIRSAEMNPTFCRLVRERLSDLLAEMADPALPIRRTEDRKTCGYCDFKIICGR